MFSSQLVRAEAVQTLEEKGVGYRNACLYISYVFFVLMFLTTFNKQGNEQRACVQVFCLFSAVYTGCTRGYIWLFTKVDARQAHPSFAKCTLHNILCYFLPWFQLFSLKQHASPADGFITIATDLTAWGFHPLNLAFLCRGRNLRRLGKSFR